MSFSHAAKCGAWPRSFSITTTSPINHDDDDDMARRQRRGHQRESTPLRDAALARPTNAPETPLSPTAQRNIDRALAHGWAPRTMAGYAAAVRAFQRYCQGEGIPASDTLPATENALCAFAASHAGTRAGATARNNLAAIKAWHAYYNAEWRGGPRLRYVLAGVTNLAPPASSRAKRPPVTTQMLEVLTRDLDASVQFDACVLAVAQTAFWGQCRLGELLPHASTADPTKRPRLMDLKLRPTRGEAATILHLPSTKNAVVRGEDIALVSRVSEQVDAPRALFHHIKTNELKEQDPLFSYRVHARTQPTLRRMTTNAFLARCNELWTRAGLARATGHAFRIGGTTELLIAGIDTDVVRAMGRWSSDAFLKYWRTLDQLIPRHVHQALSRRSRIRVDA